MRAWHDADTHHQHSGRCLGLTASERAAEGLSGSAAHHFGASAHNLAVSPYACMATRQQDGRDQDGGVQKRAERSQGGVRSVCRCIDQQLCEIVHNERAQ
jgi:hypothetical protein